MSDSEHSVDGTARSGPNYDVEIDADRLLADLADDAASYGEEYERHRETWQDSFDAPTPFYDAKYWMLEAVGGRRAYSNTMAKLQPSGRFRNADGTVDVRALFRWLKKRSTQTNEARNGDYTKTRQSSEAHSAYSSIISTLRDDYGVGWPRLDDVSGTPLESDLP